MANTGWTSNHTKLRDALAQMYWDKESAQRIAVESGLDPALVTFSDNAANNWHEIIRKADAQGVLIPLVEKALAENKTNQTLREVLDTLKTQYSPTKGKAAGEPSAWTPGWERRLSLAAHIAVPLLVLSLVGLLVAGLILFLLNDKLLELGTKLGSLGVLTVLVVILRALLPIEWWNTLKASFWTHSVPVILAAVLLAPAAVAVWARSTIPAIHNALSPLPPLPVMPRGPDPNIAVAPFGEYESTKVVASSRGSEISRELYEWLQDELGAAGLRPVWIQAGLPVVDTPQEAGALANAVNADLVIYGRVTSEGTDRLTIRPYFYVAIPAGSASTRQPLASFEVASTPTADTNASPGECRESLRERSASVITFTVGLVQYLMGHADEAVPSFDQALQATDAKASEMRFEGFLFSGSALAERRRPGDLEQALDRYAQAAEIDHHRSPRPYIGRGNVDLELAMQAKTWTEQAAFLAQGLSEYKEAEDRNNPEAADVTAKLHVGRGSIALWQAQTSPASAADRQRELAVAKQEFMAVVSAYERGITEVRYQAPEAYLNLGAVYQREGDLANAAACYHKSGDITSRKEVRVEIDNRLPGICRQLEQGFDPRNWVAHLRWCKD